MTGTPTSIGDRIAVLVTAGAHLTHDAAWAAEALRRNAIDDLVRARDIMRTAGDDAASALKRAMTDAPEARTFWQGTIRPPGAEAAAHTTLDGLSMVPGYVGPAAAGLNALWYLAEGRRGDAGWAAAGVVPVGRVAHGAVEGVEALGRARTFSTKAEVLAREAEDLDGMATDFGLTKIGDQTYRSPAGLVYGPVGHGHYEESHRLSHVLAHWFTDPSKKNHGVFLGTSADAVALLDRAFEMRAQPVAPGTFIVQMSDRIGTAGETCIRLVVDDVPGVGPVVTTAYPVGSAAHASPHQ